MDEEIETSILCIEMPYTVSWLPDTQENLAGQQGPRAETKGIAQFASTEKVLSIHELRGLRTCPASESRYSKAR